MSDSLTSYREQLASRIEQLTTERTQHGQQAQQYEQDLRTELARHIKESGERDYGYAVVIGELERLLAGLAPQDAPTEEGRLVHDGTDTALEAATLSKNEDGSLTLPGEAPA